MCPQYRSKNVVRSGTYLRTMQNSKIFMVQSDTNPHYQTKLIKQLINNMRKMEKITVQTAAEKTKKVGYWQVRNVNFT